MPHESCCQTFDGHVGGMIELRGPDYPVGQFAPGAPRWCVGEPGYYGEMTWHAIDFCPWCGERLEVL